MISLCMIVKNEAALLPRALANWRELADEVIVVDTGSDDSTVEVAMGLGARVMWYDWQYPGNKGAARNVALNSVAGQWVVILDADEVITDPAGLRSFLLEGAGDLDGLHVQFHNIDEAGQVYMAWTQLRIFRAGRYRYIHREHELPQPTDDQPRQEKALSVVFEHRPPSDRAQAKLQPMIDRLTLDVEEHPDDPHPVYFLHRQYALAGQWPDAISWGQRYLSLAKDRGIDRCECYGNLAHCHLQIDQAHIAVQYLHRAAADQPQRRIWWIRLAEVYYNQHQFNLALALLRCAAELWPQNEQHYQPVANTNYLYQLIQRCQAALATGEHQHG